ncbi:hypothetical protein TSUD_02810 [Trifolium subterraneum]|uniref:glycerophosphodiester phosphodiesterase n=1 Tax=Trifolium subterraneum TaxID=3900 RepID=A0A2Z6M691_TRISU|nr:hypothetical protein TSUD_02810 [Trifolium subterraneum]
MGFLRSIKFHFDPKKTKLIFRYLLLEFWFQEYIWSVDTNGYLQSHTNLVSEAHKVDLEVFVSEYANEKLSSYNYSHDPLAEYLQFVDNGDFSVDGVLSDFPITASEAIASREYPGCTDLSYKQAILDGVDVLDCSVQVSKDGTPFCLSSIDLLESSTVGQTSFNHLVRSIPEIQSDPGLFTFNLSWADIKGLTPDGNNPLDEDPAITITAPDLVEIVPSKFTS